MGFKCLEQHSINASNYLRGQSPSLIHCFIPVTCTTLASSSAPHLTSTQHRAWYTIATRSTYTKANWILHLSVLKLGLHFKLSKMAKSIWPFATPDLGSQGLEGLSGSELFHLGQQLLLSGTAILKTTRVLSLPRFPFLCHCTWKQHNNREKSHFVDKTRPQVFSF